MKDLVEFEVQLLEAMAGKRPAFQWGAAVGACLESLRGFGLVEVEAGKYSVSDAGHAELAERGLC